MEDFDLAWDSFLVNGTHKNPSPPRNDLSNLIRSVTLIAPSLPAPSGIMRTLRYWALPDIYGHCTHHHNARRNCLIVDFPETYIISLKCGTCEPIPLPAHLSDDINEHIDKLVSKTPPLQTTVGTLQPTTTGVVAQGCQGS